MADQTVHLYRTAERPDVRLWVRDDDGNLIDFNGYTLVFKLGNAGSAATFTKSSGITGAAGSGVAPPGVGTPNVTMTFTGAELDALVASNTTGQVKATSGGLDRYIQFPVTVHDVIT